MASCYHPLKAIVLGKNPNGKKNIVFDPIAYEHGFYHGRYIPEKDRVLLPCGQCSGCRIQRSREWADRCMMELQDHDSSYFVTLTYNPVHIQARCAVDKETGALHDWYSLNKRDFQLFMKRLRKSFPNDRIRFFACGEYGSETFRPHFHAILFGLHLDDLTLYKKSPQGFSYYKSEKLQRVWSEEIEIDEYDEKGKRKKIIDPIGFAVVAPVTWETCAYTARYVMKKMTGKEAQFYEDFDLEPEFSLMSRKPGIARNYYDNHPDIYEKEYINLKTEKGGLKFRPPRYFDKLYDVEHPEESEALKNVRKKLAVEAQKIKLSRTTLSPDELLAVEERNFTAKIKTLRRPLE